jgi:hypothetical protein
MKQPVPGEPTATLPKMAPEFGLKPRADYLPWSYAVGKLEKARNYWRKGAIYFGTARDSRKWRNLAANPNIVIHLESGEDVVIEGIAREITIYGEVVAE